jgi:hypothetical protein
MIARIGLKTGKTECSWRTGLAPHATIYPTLLVCPEKFGLIERFTPFGPAHPMAVDAATDQR